MTVDDLTPDALAKLEAKLLADLEVVRKVRAVLQEHGIPLGKGAAPQAVGASAPPFGAAAPAGVVDARALAPAPVPSVPAPQAAGPSYDEIFTGCLRAMPPEGFNLGVLKNAMRKTHVNVSDSRVKQDINRLIRQGKVVVVTAATGRIGSTYRYVVPAEPSAENTPPSAPEASPDAEKADTSTTAARPNAETPSRPTAEG